MPLYLWLIVSVIRQFWNKGEGIHVVPLFIYQYIPLPFFQPIADNQVMVLLKCFLVALFWLIVSIIVLNVWTEKAVVFERIEEKWRRACLHCGLTTDTNLLTEKDVKEHPNVISITPKYFVISSGFIRNNQIK